ncbi:3-methyl-2-oxobutanoate hydroxymethyltransferase [Synechococcus sp. MEDNS5]|uniref:3-methyl-2-oxobutanoate hydroxymethyltransferase n=1 Tax=Synechococcus sp. MEDNS5 TaxID=1442554 RepID=UPI0016453A37|nr:3-methyl-2-oxobutanoate hydroxymethyltransferase [Synechococcus sp. MEDNS5]QNJ06631.1 3-methyl-2-oxobutanoate hydroxymethyltransferase [Synechococcus sp. MEDNS5]
MRASDLIRFKQSGRTITMLTAWDALSASVVEEAGADIVLVGDSLAMVSLGHATTLPVTLEQMLLHTQAVCRGLRKPPSEQPLVITDLPFLSYQCGLDRAVAAAGHLLKHSSAAGVKLEGAEPEVVEVIERLVRMGIPVMGHLGLTPQSVHQLGYRRQAKDPVSQERLLRQATSLEMAGCFAMVLEHVPEALAGRMRENLQIPVIGIGAGQDCDGQVSVTADLLGLTPMQPPFSPARLDGRTLGIEALRSWLEEQRHPAADPTTAQPPPGSDC